MIKSFLWVGLLVLGLQSARAFSLAGPIGNNPKPSGGAGIKGDLWQLPVIGYGLAGDINAPKNIGEEYRPNIPVMYYACDANFLGFFGSNGVVAVNQAFDILNSAFTNNPTGLANGLDGYSADLSEFSLETRHMNYQAQAMGLYDLKSWTLGVMTEQLGLADPVRYNFTLHDRLHEPGAGIPPCPGGMDYLVVQRNFDFITTPLNQLQYSPYINDTLYSYHIVEFCTGPNPLATTYFPALGTPFALDPLADTYSSVASWVSGTAGFGVFFSGLTRDDVAGLRYLLTANNINFENGPAGSVQLSSTGGGTGGFGPPFPLSTSNYTAFAQTALVTDPVTLANLFPGLIITSSTLSWVVVNTPIIVAYFTNNFVFGNPPVLVVKTNGYTQSAVAHYAYTFANLVIITNTLHPTTSAKLVTVNVSTGGVLGNPLVTNISTKTITLSNQFNTVWPSATYYIDTNVPACNPIVLLSPQPPGFPITNVVVTTNFIFAASNSAGFFTSQSILVYSTNYVFIAQAPICATVTSTGAVASATGLYKGIQKMQFINAPFDSLIGQTFQPITNTFTSVFIAGSKTQTNTFQRIVTTPDFVFSAADITAGPQDPIPPNPYSSVLDRGVNFDQGNALAGLAGPGLINPSTTITLNKVGPVYFNYSALLDGTPYFNESPGNDRSDLYYGLYFNWASFDGSTNDPVVYPDGMSIQNLEDQIVVQITPESLDDGASGVDYGPVTFTASGGAFSYSPIPPTWTVPVSGSSGLPPGMTLSPDGTLSGTPTQAGTYDFILKMTDSLSRSVQWFYSITIQ